ncbi:MAG: carbon-nitrogen hydrolase family protein [Actinomycetota bacterium]|nr:carbon-nitrogen hydrolase family protein [Actinomycetota bacterium]
MTRVTAAAVQAAPVFLDRTATIEKACALIEEAASKGAGLIVFPEAFVPTYPDWVWRATVWHDERLFARLSDQAVVVPSPATDMLAAAAKSAHAYVAMGVNEREEKGSTLYNTLLYFNDTGSLIGKHRKLMPTGGERLVWGMGDGSTLAVFESPFGRIGGLICWENYMPLARVAMYAQGVEIWLAPTWDNSDTWISTLRHIAKEGRCFVIGVAACQRGSDVPEEWRGELYGGEEDWMSKGSSAIVGPEGDILTGPVAGKEVILYADLDVTHARASRRQFDAVGHYARPDVFTLTVDTTARSASSSGTVPSDT